MPDLGQKHICFKCSCKFYDMGRPEPLCPQCGADQRESPNPDPREAFLSRYRRPSRKRKKKKKEPEPKKVEKSDDDDDDSLLDDLDD